MLQGRIVCGINDQRTQKKLLAEKTLSFDRAMEIALAVKSATKGARNITSGMCYSTLLHIVSDRTPPIANFKCFHCGRGNHKPTECYLKDATCNKCNKKGHIAKVCHSRPHTSVPQTKRNPLQVNAAPLDTSSSEENEEYSLFAVHNTKDSTKPLVVSMTFNDKKISMKIDTGSAMTVFPESTYRSISTEPLQESTIKLCTYSREQLEVKGTAMCKVENDDKVYRLPVVALAGNGPILLSCSWLYHILLQWNKLFYSV